MVLFCNKINASNLSNSWQTALLLLLIKCAPAMAQTIQLAPPKIRFLEGESLLFYKQTTISLEFDLPGAKIHFTTDGSEPDFQSQKTTPGNPILIKKSTKIRAASFHPDFKKSEIVDWCFLKINKKTKPKTVHLKTLPSPKYPGDGAASLCDAKNGTADFRDGRWLGFQGENLEATFLFRGRGPAISRLSTNLWSDENSWIFLPKSIKIYAKKRKNQPFKLLYEEKLGNRTAKKGPIRATFPMPVFRKKAIKIIVEPFGNLPENHPGAGSPAWLFVDEIIFEK